MVLRYNQKGNKGKNERKIVGKCREFTKQEGEVAGVLPVEGAGGLGYTHSVRKRLDSTQKNR